MTDDTDGTKDEPGAGHDRPGGDTPEGGFFAPGPEEAMADAASEPPEGIFAPRLSEPIPADGHPEESEGSGSDPHVVDPPLTSPTGSASGHIDASPGDAPGGGLPTDPDRGLPSGFGAEFIDGDAGLHEADVFFEGPDRMPDPGVPDGDGAKPGGGGASRTALVRAILGGLAAIALITVGVIALNRPGTDGEVGASPVASPATLAQTEEGDAAVTVPEDDVVATTVPVASTVPAEEATTMPEVVSAPTETYHLQMPSGEQFPLYYFVIDGADPQLGIVLRSPDTCWVLQSGPGEAAVDGACTAVIIGDAQVATRLLTGSTRYVIALPDSDLLAVGDETGNQGVETDLAAQRIATVVVDGGSVDIGGELFETG